MRFSSNTIWRNVQTLHTHCTFAAALATLHWPFFWRLSSFLTVAVGVVVAVAAVVVVAVVVAVVVVVAAAAVDLLLPVPAISH